ncbi:MAG: hypothetical protein AAFX39_06750 [Pseudomonadota bacterium]
MGGLFSAATAPQTRRLDPGSTARDFSFDDIKALAAQYRDWAEQETTDAHRRTRLLDWACDCDAIAAWVGTGWAPSQPSGRSLTRAVLTKRRASPPGPVRFQGQPDLRLVAVNP